MKGSLKGWSAERRNRGQLIICPTRVHYMITDPLAEPRRGSNRPIDDFGVYESKHSRVENGVSLQDCLGLWIIDWDAASRQFAKARADYNTFRITDQ